MNNIGDNEDPSEAGKRIEARAQVIVQELFHQHISALTAANADGVERLSEEQWAWSVAARALVPLMLGTFIDSPYRIAACEAAAADLVVRIKRASKSSS